MKWAGHKPIKCFWCEILPDRWWATTAFKNGTQREVGGFKTEEEARAWVDNERRINPTITWTRLEQSFRTPDNKEKLKFQLPPGALYHSVWDVQFFEHNMIDGICLNVVLPNGGHWCVDSQCTNCNAPRDSEGRSKPHRCWVRHGDPRTGNVDVPNEHQPGGCTVGAGSIAWGSSESPNYYHGFLRNGFLIPA